MAAILDYLRTVKLGIDNVRAHKLRSMLTALGIVFGVCSVISMLAIGEGASQQVQDQIRRLGSSNIIIQSVKPPQNPNQDAQTGNFLLEYGLTYTDLEYLSKTLPGLESIVPVKSQEIDLWVGARKKTVTLVATAPWFINNGAIDVLQGHFITPVETDERSNVIAVGQDVARELFQVSDPMGQPLRVDNDVYRVVGILGSAGAAAGDSGGVKLASQGGDAFVPITTWRTRLGDSVIRRTQGGQTAEKVELTEMVVKVADPANVLATSSLIEQYLAKVHPNFDYKMVVPLRLLEEAEKTKRMFKLVLSSIAAISLLVGGIGIMNIMLASVSERTREIGVRRALGARQRDIMAQFLVETVILSVGGGLLGMGLGAIIPTTVEYVSTLNGNPIPAVLTPGAFILSFGVSAMVGLVFGIYPARRAALMDPIEALRHE